MDQKFGHGIQDDSDFNNQMLTLQNLITTHVQYEESEILPMIETRLSFEDVKDLNTNFENIKSMAPTRPHPDGPHSAAGKLATGPIVALLDRIRDSTKSFVNP